jgi:hypothetical protein
MLPLDAKPPTIKKQQPNVYSVPVYPGRQLPKEKGQKDIHWFAKQ